MLQWEPKNNDFLKNGSLFFILGKYAVVLSTIMILVNGVSCMAPQSPKHTVAYAKVVLISYPTGSLLKHWLSLRIEMALQG